MRYSTCIECHARISLRATRCKACASKRAWLNPDYRKARTAQSKTAALRRWKNPQWRQRTLDAIRTPRVAKIKSLAAKKSWKNPEARRKRAEGVKKYWQDPASHARHRAMLMRPDIQRRINEASVKRFQNPRAHQKLSRIHRRLWQNAEYRAKQTAIFNLPEVRAKKSGDNSALKRPEVRARHWAATHSPEYIAKHSGKKCHFYIHGKTHAPYGQDFTPSLRRQIRDRDCHRCRQCGMPEDGRALHVHHIDYNKKHNEPRNLIALCIRCHRKTNTDRPYWTAVFQGANQLSICP